MPWARNRWVEYCNPIKLKEYLALGKPVVSTPFSELSGYRGLVVEAEGPVQFAAALRRAVLEDSEGLRRARRERAKRHSWSAKADEAARVIGESAVG